MRRRGRGVASKGEEPLTPLLPVQLRGDGSGVIEIAMPVGVVQREPSSHGSGRSHATRIRRISRG